MWRTIKIDVQVGELTLLKILQSEKSFADTSGEWNLLFYHSIILSILLDNNLEYNDFDRPKEDTAIAEERIFYEYSFF